MSTRRPKVSVGLPVYNGDRFIGEALNSIMAQTLQDFELIVSDNASTDRTELICREYAARDARIRYCRNDTNVGASKNYNRVFELSTGKYFKWLACDDSCAPSFLAYCVEALEHNPAAVLAYPRAICIDGNGSILHRYEGIIEDVGWPENPVDRFRRLVDGFVDDGGVSAPPYMYGVIRSNLLRRTRLLGNYVSSDLNLLAELALVGTFVVVRDHLSFVRSHPGSSTWPEAAAWWERVQEGLDPTVSMHRIGGLVKWRRHAELLFSVVQSNLEPRQKAILLSYSSGAALRRLGKRVRRHVAGGFGDG